MDSEKEKDLIDLALAMAHDLRTPLATLTGLAYLMEKSFESRYVGRMKEQLLLCESMIQNFLEFASGRPQKKESIDIKRILEELASVCFFSSDIAFILERSSPCIHADGVHVKQIFLNLLKNAREAVEEKKGEVRVVLSEENGYGRIDVFDNGPGIPENRLSSLFDLSCSTRKKGYGLGLPMVRKLVLLNEGRIEVRSKPGEGTVFSVYLPLC